MGDGGLGWGKAVDGGECGVFSVGGWPRAVANAFGVVLISVPAARDCAQPVDFPDTGSFPHEALPRHSPTVLLSPAGQRFPEPRPHRNPVYPQWPRLGQHKHGPSASCHQPVASATPTSTPPPPSQSN